jgi:hypothetical protein
LLSDTPGLTLVLRFHSVSLQPLNARGYCFVASDRVEEIAAAALFSHANLPARLIGMFAASADERMDDRCTSQHDDVLSFGLFRLFGAERLLKKAEESTPQATWYETSPKARLSDRRLGRVVGAIGPGSVQTGGYCPAPSPPDAREGHRDEPSCRVR